MRGVGEPDHAWWYRRREANERYMGAGPEASQVSGNDKIRV